MRLESMKTPYTSVLLASMLVLTTATLPASETDDRIEAAAKSSYVFKTFLKEDPITTSSKDGAVTLTGTVKDADHKQLAQTPWRSCPA